jgi:hypothetical protein
MDPADTKQIADTIILGFFCLVALVILIPIIVFIRKRAKAAERRSQNLADGVIGSWGNARITATELIYGYNCNAMRYPLAGCTAYTSQSGSYEERVRRSSDGEFQSRSVRDTRKVHLTVRGPHGTLVFSSPLGKIRMREALDPRKFIDQLEAAGRQLQAAAHTPGGATQTTPPGWYTDPNGGPGQQYWDGQQWNLTPQPTTATHQPQAAARTPGATATQTTPPGWYPDPNGGQAKMYWDGQQWHGVT